MGTEVSGRELARALHKAESAIRKAEKAGRIKRLPSGRFDLEASLQRFKATADPLRTPVAKGAQNGAQNRRFEVRKGAQAVTTLADAKEAIALIAAVLKSEGIAAPDEIDLTAVRTAEVILKVRQRDLAIAERCKLLVPSIPVQQHYAKAFVGLKRTMQGMPARHASEMAARLGCDPAALDLELGQMIHATLVEMSAPVPPAGLPVPPQP